MPSATTISRVPIAAGAAGAATLGVRELWLVDHAHRAQPEGRHLHGVVEAVAVVLAVELLELLADEAGRVGDVVGHRHRDRVLLPGIAGLVDGVA